MFGSAFILTKHSCDYVEDMEATDEILRDIAVRLFIAKHDSNETFGEMASTAYANAGVSFADEDDNQSPTVLLLFLSHECFAVREATVNAFATAVEQLPTGVASVLAKLFALSRVARMHPSALVSSLRWAPLQTRVKTMTFL